MDVPFSLTPSYFSGQPYNILTESQKNLSEPVANTLSNLSSISVKISSSKEFTDRDGKLAELNPFIRQHIPKFHAFYDEIMNVYHVGNEPNGWHPSPFMSKKFSILTLSPFSPCSLHRPPKKCQGVSYRRDLQRPASEQGCLHADPGREAPGSSRAHLWGHPEANCLNEQDLFLRELLRPLLLVSLFPSCCTLSLSLAPSFLFVEIMSRW